LTDTVFNLFSDSSPRAITAPHSLTARSIVILLGVSCGLMNLRVGSLQPEDFVLLGLLWLCITRSIYSGFSVDISTRVNSLFRAYSWFILCLVVMGLLATRLTLYPLDDASFLKQPILFPASKLLQLTAVICGFLWLTNQFAKHRSFLSLALNTYWWTGIATCLYGVVCYFFLKLHPFEVPEIFGAYSLEDYTRARGFFNEGGPLGLYAVSVLMVGLLRSRVTGRRLGVVCTSVLCLAIILSGSKSGFLAAAALILVSAFFAASAKARIFYCIFAIASLWGLGVWLNFDSQLAGYVYSYMNIEEEIAERGRDYNLVVGRVSALHIVPKMIATHPFTGIGFGNYPLMRNDPNYLDGLPAITEVEDLPGLGLLGVAAEIGVPATVWLIVLFLIPYWKNREKGVVVASAALFQPIAHILGMQITFFIPWFVTACALGTAFSVPSRSLQYGEM
jgi:hypothetical protein